MFKAIFSFLTYSFVNHVDAQQSHISDLEILSALNAKFIHNFVTNDTISHSRLIHKDFVCITSSGQYINRKDYLEGWLHGFDDYVYWDYRAENIKIFGNTALVHAANKYVVIRDGKQTTGMSMYTDVYVNDSGEWRCVQAQISKVAPEFFPGDETIVRKYDFRK